MKNSHDKQSTKAAWKRILAIALAFSMVIIPVQFPTTAEAAGEATAEAQLFSDDFTNKKYFEDATYRWTPAASDGLSVWNPIEVEPVDVTLQWVDCAVAHPTWGKTNFVDRDANDPVKGKALEFYSANGSGFVLIPTATDGANNFDVIKDMTDYTLEFDMMRTGTNKNTGAMSDSGSPVVFFRVSRNADDNGYIGYALKFRGTSLQLFRAAFLDGARWTYLDYVASTCTMSAETWYHTHIAISSNTIVINLTDMDGNAAAKTLTYVDPDNYSDHGTIAIYNYSNSNDNTSNNAYYDNFKMTFNDGTVIKETFDGRENFTDSFVSEDGYLPRLENPWKVESGIMYVDATQLTYANQIAMPNAVSPVWFDYTTGVDVKVPAGASASVLARANGVKYYELRYGASGVQLIKVNGTTETVLAADATVVPADDSWGDYLELTVKGNVLTGYINGKQVITANDDAYTSGIGGVKAIDGVVSFDNFAMYNDVAKSQIALKTFGFDAEALTDIEGDWALSGNGLKLVDKKLVNDGNEPAIAALRGKTAMMDYAATVTFTTADSGNIVLYNRSDALISRGYALAFSMTEGLILIKFDGNSSTDLAVLSIQDLYKIGFEIYPDTTYTMKLSTVDGGIRAYFNGVYVMSAEDAAPLDAGISAVVMEPGYSVTSLELEVPPVLSVTDFYGNVVDVVKVPYGNTVDISLLKLQAKYLDGTIDTVKLDTLSIGEFKTAVGAYTTTVEYDGAVYDLAYEIYTRPEFVEQLEADINALPANITLNNADAVKELAARYDSLTVLERNNFSATAAAKLQKAEKAIVDLQYPAIADDPIVFTDSFDNAGNADLYCSKNTFTGDSDTGHWYIENGNMINYDNYAIKYTGVAASSNILLERDFETTSVSVDVMFLGENTWAGINLCDRNGMQYHFRITNKTNIGGGCRYVLCKSNTQISQLYETNPDNWFKVGQWYNLRVTLDNGYIRCYVDDVLWNEYQDVHSAFDQDIYTHGSVSLYTSEGWAKFDNLEVRGTEIPYTEEFYPVTENTDLPETRWEDDFEDETVGSDPSHWMEGYPADNWSVVKDGTNKIYSIAAANKESHSWLHVFETDVDLTAELRVNEIGSYAVAGLTARLTALESYVKAGYDFTMNRWFIKVQNNSSYAPETTYSADVAAFTLNKWYKVRLVAIGDQIQLYADNQLVVSAKAELKVTPGRIGVFVDNASMDVDDVAAKFLAGDGYVQDGVLDIYSWQINGNKNDSTRYNVLQLPDGSVLLDGGSGSAGDFLMSADGKIFSASTVTCPSGDLSTLRLHDGSLFTITGFQTASLSTDGAKTWTTKGTIPYTKNVTNKYSQPSEHLSEVQLPDGSYRIFFCMGDQMASNLQADGVLRTVITDVWYTDDLGVTWTKEERGAKDISNLQYWCESHVIATKGVLEGDPLIHYTTYNSSRTMRYALSYDGGKTWEGDYAMPQFPSGINSFTIEQDIETGYYYMAAPFNVAVTYHQSMPRNRIALFRSVDGFNWEFLCDVDSWGEAGDGEYGWQMHYVNMQIAVTDDYIFVTNSRFDDFAATTHMKQLGRIYRFEKDKLEAREWPSSFVTNPKAITYIEAVPGTTEFLINSEFTADDVKLKVHYYDGSSDLVDIEDTIVRAPAMDTLGKAYVSVDYKWFRAVYTIDIVAGDAPVLNAVDGETYCVEKEVAVTDANGDLESVTLDGVAVTLVDGKFTVSAKEDVQTIIATDKAGNVTTVKITVNANHTGGEATCTDKAKCEVCGESYGELNADKHTKEAKWAITADKHSKAYECCGAVVVAEGAHTGGSATCEDKAVCSVCNTAYGELAAHKGGEATCTDKAKCDVCGESYGELNADKHTKEAKWATTADKHSKAYECCGAEVVAEGAHTGGTATCEDKAICSVCNAAYGELAAHKGGTATCTDKAKCDVCGEAYGELNADKHTKEAKWTITADKHSKAYECCGKVVVAEEAHQWKDGKCEECGYEAAPGTAEKPIEIPADKETVKEEAKVEAGEEQHYELDEKMAGMTITIKGEGAYAIIDGKKYEAVDGVLEVKLPSKTGKIPVVIGNAGTKAGAFSITVATPSEDNSDTGDNTAIVLFGSLMALSVLAAGALLIPDVRKRIFQ